MSWVTLLVYLLPTFLTAIYVVNYGRWAGRRGNVRGAIGLYVLAAVTVLVPGTVLLLRR